MRRRQVFVTGGTGYPRESALRLGLVSLHQMVAALVAAVEDPVDGVKFAGVPEIRDAGRRILI